MRTLLSLDIFFDIISEIPFHLEILDEEAVVTGLFPQTHMILLETHNCGLSSRKDAPCGNWSYRESV